MAQSEQRRLFRMSEVMAEFYDGPHATPPESADGPVYLGIKNITEDGRLDLSQVRHISEADFAHWTRRVEPRGGDLVFTYEASLHRYAILPPGFRGALGRRVALLRPRQEVADARYLLYAFIGPEWRATVQQRLNVGSTVDRLPLVDFPSFPISLPDLPRQRKIASILSAYDELIENNTRRIEILEEMAQATYREWFVNFRYPGHEDVPLVDSELGQIPEGWSMITLGESARWLSGGTPSTTNPAFWDGDIPWITSGSLTSLLLDRSDRRITQEGLANGTRLVDRDTVLFVVRGMSLVKEFRVGIADVPVAFGQDCKALIANTGVEPLFLAFGLITMAGEVQAMVELAGHGTGKLSTDRLKAIPLPLPPRDVQQKFSATITPIRNLMTNLRLSTDALRQARDLLLPRLISGGVDVSDLDIDVGELAS
jgi:type I restriction enzyme S subunit